MPSGCFSIAGEKYSFDGYVACGKKPKSDIAKVARGFLNAPYLWGGRSFFGIDCSGLVQLCYRLCGRKLPRDAKDQAQGGEVLSFIEEAEEGDLAFFDNEEGVMVHCGNSTGRSHDNTRKRAGEGRPSGPDRYLQLTDKQIHP